MTGPAGIKPVLDDQTFKNALSMLAAPLTVVTTRDEKGRRWGLTASSVTSASLTPPLIIVGIARTSSCSAAFAEAPEFVINVLAEQHRGLARRFAASRIDRFHGQDFAVWPGSRLPFVADAHVAFRCEAADRIRVGDHDLLVGRPTEVCTDGSTAPLFWYRRNFGTPA
ncbi:flavin reductase family protein [Streptomyces sp. DSM 3412]|uniref:Flavin reductase family protein n=1 Tax=Streptomyces gottesmaniae TaxID=3075518 RepID=A0ABU2YQY9_9ACTN|nr:flavin reductase family protein [Streptomyces sp. DSM 3412]MDT0566728.1 flavin reductase family protein [Streptomyces sp. DSM 3412]